MELSVLIKHRVMKKEITEFVLGRRGAVMEDAFLIPFTGWVRGRGLELHQLSTSYNSVTKQEMGGLYGDTKTPKRTDFFCEWRGKRRRYVLVNYG